MLGFGYLGGKKEEGGDVVPCSALHEGDGRLLTSGSVLASVQKLVPPPP